MTRGACATTNIATVTHARTYIYKYALAHTHTHTRTHKHIHTYTHTHTRARAHTCMPACMHACMHTCMHCVHACVCVRVCACAQVCVRMCSSKLFVYVLLCCSCLIDIQSRGSHIHFSGIVGLSATLAESLHLRSWRHCRSLPVARGSAGATICLKHICIGVWASI